MKLSRKTDYAILLIDALKATRKPRSYMRISEIAIKNNLPKLFLGKIAQILLARGILESKKGNGGGYRLKKDPKKITLFDVIRIFEQEETFQCVKHPRPNEACPVARFSPSEKRWAEIDKKINAIFQEATFA